MFDRQWLCQKKADEMTCRDQLAAMINNPESAKPDADFAEVILKCQYMLRKIMMGMSKPFLLQSAEAVCQALESESSASQLHQLTVNSPSKNDVPVVPPAAVAVEEIADSDEHSTDDDDTVLLATNGSDSVFQTNASHISGSKPTKISSVDDLWRPSTEWKKGAGKAVGKIPWSAVEEEQVYRGVLAHGVGNWARIRAKFVPNRSNVDVKDKWRTMKRQGRLQTLADKLGPVPANCLDTKN